VAVATGIALKDVVASLVAGLIILVDKPFQVGDRVTFEGEYGEITFIGLRSTRLETLDRVTITIPNNRFLTEVVASGNAGHVEMMIRMNVYIGVDQDVSVAKRIVQEALTTSRYFHLQKPWNVSVSQVILEGYLAIQLGAKAYILDTRFENAFRTDVTEAILAGFHDAGIQPPAVLERKVNPGPSVSASPGVGADRGAVIDDYRESA
jgi:small-conductance mechanosensitive channel